LEALLETGSRDEMLGKVVRWLMEERKSGRWRSTQENVCSVSALSAYFEIFEHDTPDFKAEITLSGQRVLAEMFHGRSLETRTKLTAFNNFPAEKKLDASIRKIGTGMLYYGIRMNYYPLHDSIPRDEGIGVVKTITPIDSATVSAGTFVAGHTYKVTLTIVSPQERHFVVVDDPLPAGFEPVNLSFNTESQTPTASVAGGDDEDGEGDGAEQVQWWGGINHVEQKDDRVLLFADDLSAGVHTYSYIVRAVSFGTFAMPGTHAEEMYAPDVFANGTSQTIIVK
jgi:uncharacterized protein YfaS (alpha-2-macroglobulin family)